MPSTGSSRLQPLVSWPLLAAGILGLLLVPLHRIIIPLWPSPVEEVFIFDSGQNSTRLQPGRRFGGDSPETSGRVSSQPRYAVRIEQSNADALYGYVLGFREPEQGILVDQPVDPDWVWLEAGQLPEGVEVVVEDADGSRFFVDAAAVVRLVRPNRLTASDKFRLTWVRLKRTWEQRLGERKNPLADSPGVEFRSRD